jgi:hypothetical protein
MKATIESLKKSPLFNLSLSSKELFHSNFIGWVISNYPNEMWNIFSKYTDLDAKKFKIKENSVFREQNHIDIMFDVIEKDGDEKNEHKIIIENKVKSLPYFEQLQEYSKKFKGAKCILLSLSTPSHLLKDDVIIEVDHHKWHLLTYEQFTQDLSLQFMNSNALDSKNISNYQEHLISDYIFFVDHLVKIDKETAIQENEIFNWYNEKLKKDLNEIRLFDFYIKKKCENLSLKIFDKFKSDEKWNGDLMRINSSIVQSTNGEIRFYYKFNERISISIEVSEMYYRKMVHVTNQIKKNKEILKFTPRYEPQDVFDYFNSINWFDFEHIKMKNENYTQRKEFNQFWDTRYRQCKLNEENTINDIINYFNDDFKDIIKSADKINEKFK